MAKHEGAAASGDERKDQSDADGLGPAVTAELPFSEMISSWLADGDRLHESTPSAGELGAEVAAHPGRWRSFVEEARARAHRHRRLIAGGALLGVILVVVAFRQSVRSAAIADLGDNPPPVAAAAVPAAPAPMAAATLPTARAPAPATELPPAAAAPPVEDQPAPSAAAPAVEAPAATVTPEKAQPVAAAQPAAAALPAPPPPTTAAPATAAAPMAPPTGAPTTALPVAAPPAATPPPAAPALEKATNARAVAGNATGVAGEGLTPAVASATLPREKTAGAEAKGLTPAVASAALPRDKPVSAEPPAPTGAPADTVRPRRPEASARATDSAPAAPPLEGCKSALLRQRARDALSNCRQVFASDPRSADAMVLLARADLLAGRPGETLQLAHRAVVANPRHADAYLLIGTVQQTEGRRTEARTAYETYLQLAPLGAHATDVKAILRTL